MNCVWHQREPITPTGMDREQLGHASNLSSKGVPLDSIRELPGHNNLNTTLGYIYNPLTEIETFNLIVNAL